MEDGYIWPARYIIKLHVLLSFSAVMVHLVNECDTWEQVYSTDSRSTVMMNKCDKWEQLQYCHGEWLWQVRTVARKNDLEKRRNCKTHYTCQSTKYLMTNSLILGSFQISRFKTWQENSEVFWMFTSIHLLSSVAWACTCIHCTKYNRLCVTKNKKKHGQMIAFILEKNIYMLL